MKIFHFRDSRLDRVDERSTMYQMAQYVFLLVGSVTPVNIKMGVHLRCSVKE